MSLLAAVVTLAAAAEPTAIMVQTRSGLSVEELKKSLGTIDAEVTRVAPEAWSVDETSKRLKAAGLSDAASCGGKLPCLSLLAGKLSARWLVTVSVSKIGRDRAWSLGAFDLQGGAQVAKEEWLDETGADVSGPVTRFADRLATLIKPKEKVVDPPVAVKVEPRVEPPPPVAIAQPAVPSSSLLPKVLLIGAGVAAAAAIGLAAGAGVTYGPVTQTTQVGDLRLSMLSTSQAQSAASTATGLTGAAIAAAVVALGLGVGALFTW